MQQGPLPGSRQRVEGAAARARASEREDIERRLIEPTTNPMRANRNRQREIQSMDDDISGDPYEIFDKFHEDNREDTTQENREYERTPDGQIRPYRGNDESDFMRAEQQRSNIEVRGTVADDMKGLPNDMVGTVPGISGDTERALYDMGISTVADLYKRLDRAVEEVPDENRGLVKRYAFNTNSYRHTPVPDNIPSQTNPEVMTLDEIDRMAMLKQDPIDPRGRRANVRQQTQRQPQPQPQPQNVLEQETQQTLGGSQADPQQTFARDRVGQPNQRESELESEARVDEVNSGGMTADTRSGDAMSETRTTEEATEQQIPDEFITRDDGNQQGLGEVSSESESESSEMSLDTAIEMLDGMTDGYGDRVSMDAALAELLVEKFDVPQSVWSEKNSQDVFRYGLPAEDVRRELNDEYQSQIEDTIIRLAQEQRAIQ
jgi:hypothetical protein